LLIRVARLLPKITETHDRIREFQPGTHLH
jgi:hypothetical protein